MVIMVRAADFRRALFSPPALFFMVLCLAQKHFEAQYRPIFCEFLSRVLVLYVGVGVTTLLLEADFLAYNALSQDPLAGQHLGIFLVELGVGITVGAVMITVFLGFAGRNDP